MRCACAGDCDVAAIKFVSWYASCTDRVSPAKLPRSVARARRALQQAYHELSGTMHGSNTHDEGLLKHL